MNLAARDITCDLPAVVSAVINEMSPLTDANNASRWTLEELATAKSDPTLTEVGSRASIIQSRTAIYEHRDKNPTKIARTDYTKLEKGKNQCTSARCRERRRNILHEKVTEKFIIARFMKIKKKL